MTTGDGCTMWPEGPWTVCCDAHDQAYATGGGFRARFGADFRLGLCVSRTKGDDWRTWPGVRHLNGLAMFAGTRVAGAVFWNWGLSFNWIGKDDEQAI